MTIKELLSTYDGAIAIDGEKKIGVVYSQELYNHSGILNAEITKMTVSDNILQVLTKA